MGKGMAYGGLPFLDTGCPVPDAYIYYEPNMINVWDTFSTFIHLPWMFTPTDNHLNNGLDNAEWASFNSDLQTKLGIISRGVPGFATGSPYSVWGREWTTCLLYDGPLSGLCFSKITVGMQCGMVERILIIIILVITCQNFQFRQVCSFDGLFVCFVRHNSRTLWYIITKLGPHLYSVLVPVSEVTKPGHQVKK